MIDRDAPGLIVVAHCGSLIIVGLGDGETLLEPMLSGIASQLFACSAATALGRDLDRPRNPAKRLTVE